MSKQRNSNIGMCTCGECGEIAAVRKNKAGKLYYDCLDCGRITPNHDGGQDRVLSRAKIWGEQGTPPPDCPRWIAEQWPYGRSMRDKSGREPVNRENPVNEETPEKTASSDAAQSTISPEARPRHRPKITHPPDPPEKPAPKKSPEPTPEETAEPSGFDFLE